MDLQNFYIPHSYMLSQYLPASFPEIVEARKEEIEPAKNEVEMYDPSYIFEMLKSCETYIVLKNKYRQNPAQLVNRVIHVLRNDNPLLADLVEKCRTLIENDVKE